MIEKLLTDPTAYGVVGLLTLAVTSFVKEWVIPGATHRAAIAKLEAQIARLEDENQQWTHTTLRLLGHVETVTAAATEKQARR